MLGSQDLDHQDPLVKKDLLVQLVNQVSQGSQDLVENQG